MLRRSPSPSTAALRAALVAALVVAGATLATVSRVCADTPFELPLPSWVPAPKIPEDNPLTWEKVELGRFLFYDTRLSGNQTQACASCHQQDKAFTDGLAHAVGSTGDMHPRSTMSLVNVAYTSTLTWANPNLLLLERQMEGPMFGTSPVELGLLGKENELYARLAADARYQRMFAEAFPGVENPFNLHSIELAIASFERTLISTNTPYEQYVYGLDDNAMSAAAIRGEFLFRDETRECFHCHAGFNFTTSVDAEGKIAEVSFHNTGLYNLRCSDFLLPELDLKWCNPPPSDQLCMLNTSARPRGCECDGSGPQAFGCYPPSTTGAYAFTGRTEDMGSIRTPTLRNVTLTAPYMHDGSIATLEEVIDHYAAGGRTITEGPYAGVGSESPAKGQFLRGFSLTDSEKSDLIEFLKTLTDESFMKDPRFSDPFLPITCPGDCDHDGSVSVNELVTGINIGLGDASLAMCVKSDPNGDGKVSVSELVRGINSALGGCS